MEEHHNTNLCIASTVLVGLNLLLFLFLGGHRWRHSWWGTLWLASTWTTIHRIQLPWSTMHWTSLPCYTLYSSAQTKREEDNQMWCPNTTVHQSHRANIRRHTKIRREHRGASENTMPPTSALAHGTMRKCHTKSNTKISRNDTQSLAKTLENSHAQHKKSFHCRTRRDPVLFCGRKRVTSKYYARRDTVH